MNSTITLDLPRIHIAALRHPSQLVSGLFALGMAAWQVLFALGFAA